MKRNAFSCKHIFLVSLILFFIQAPLINSQAYAQEAAGSNRPRIGLVLGGGGARGAAHAGVLKVLEENRVPLDCIIGTSMGAIVGGLYSAGVSPEEIEQLFSETDWTALFSDKPSEEYLSFRRKYDTQRLMDFELGINKNGIVLPEGMIPGQKLGFLLKKMTIQVADIDDFDRLHIPFRAVSTDLATGEAVVHKQGSLSEAMRSSMSIPGIFSPVEMDGHILVDGGIVNNLPIDVAKQMGVDIIIAVDVGTPLAKVENLKSIVDVAGQTINILTRQNVELSLAKLSDNDILIRPVLGDIKSESFKRTPEAAKLGEEAARAVIEKIKRYSVDEASYQVYLARQRGKDPGDITIGFINADKPVRVNERTVRARIKTKVGEKLDTKKLQDDLTRVYAIGDFETVDFKIVKKEEKDGLLVHTEEKSWGPNYLRFGLNLSSATEGDSDYALLTEFRMTELNDLNAEWRTFLQLGETRGIYSEWYQPLDAQGYFFINPYVLFVRQLVDSYEGNTRLFEYSVDQLGGGFDLGINFGTVAEASVGIERTLINAKPEVGDPGLPKYNDVQDTTYNAKFTYDQFDNHTFPKNGIVSGINFSVSDKTLGGDFSYEKIDFFAHKARTFAKKHTVIFSMEAGTSPEQNIPFFDEFTLGGFLALSGYNENQLSGQHKGFARAIYYYKLGQAGLAKGIYLGGSFEAGNVWDSRKDIGFDDLLYGATIFVGLDTFLGPLYLGYGDSKGSTDGRFYLYLGQTF